MNVDSDYPSPCCIELAFLMPVTVAVGLVRLAVSPSFRKTYRERQKQGRSRNRSANRDR